MKAKLIRIVKKAYEISKKIAISPILGIKEGVKGIAVRINIKF